MKRLKKFLKRSSILFLFALLITFFCKFSMSYFGEAIGVYIESLIIGYAPCELHGVKGGMNHCQDEMKKAVAAGYWNLFSFNPALKAEGKNPFTLTSKPGDGTYQDFLNNETRYSRLARSFPDRA